MVLLQGDINVLSTSTGKLAFANKLDAYYSSTVLQGDKNYSEVVGIDTVANSTGAIALVDSYVKNKAGGIGGVQAGSAVVTASAVCDYTQVNVDALNLLLTGGTISVFDLNEFQLSSPLTKDQWCNDVY